MNPIFVPPGKREVNLMIEERLRRRFGGNQALASALGSASRYTMDELATPAPAVPSHPIPRYTHSASYGSRTFNSTLNATDNQIYTPRAPATEQIRQSIPLQTAHGQANEYSFVLSSDRGIAERAAPVTVLQNNPKVIRETKTTIHQISTMSETELGTSLPPMPVPPVIVEPVHQPLSRIINVKSTESIDPVPPQHFIPKSILKNAKVNSPVGGGTTVVVHEGEVGALQARNDRLVVDIATLVEENNRLKGNLSRVTKEKELAENAMTEVVKYLELTDWSQVLERLRRLTSDLAYSEGRQVQLSEERRILEVELGKERQEARRLAEELRSQEDHKNKEIARLTAKGNTLQERLERIIESLKVRKVSEDMAGDQITRLDLQADFGEENTRLQAEVEGLKDRLLEKEHEYFARENELLQKNAALELHLEHLRDDMATAARQVQMANVRSSLEKLPREKRLEDGPDTDSKNGAELERIRTVLKTTSGDLEKARNEVNSLTTTLTMRTEELQEQEVKLFEACLRVAFLSAELERLRAAWYAKS